MNQSCKVCKGTGRVKINGIETDCMECMFDKIDKLANNMQIDVHYSTTKLTELELKQLKAWFGKKSDDREFYIDVYTDLIIKRSFIK